MIVDTHAGMTGTGATPVEVGAKHIRWGLWLFIFGLVIDYVPLAHYMHGSFEPVGEAFLKNASLWWGCAFTLAVYVAQVGSLAMIAICNGLQTVSRGLANKSIFELTISA